MAFSMARRRAARRLSTLRRQLSSSATAVADAAARSTPVVFTPETFSNPELPEGLALLDVPLTLATDESLKGFGRIVHSADEFTTEKGNFEIETWPLSGWRKMDPHCGDEAGTTEARHVFPGSRH